MMMDGSTTYDSIATNTTKEKKEGVAPPAAVRFVAARWVLGILVGAAVLIALTTTTTTELSGGLGSMVSLRSSSSRTATDTLVVQDELAASLTVTVRDDKFLPGVPTPDLNRLLPGVGTPANIAWKNEHGISGTEGQCQFCNHYKCATGIPGRPGDHPKCNRGNYLCPRYINCGLAVTTNDDKFAAVGSESACLWCTVNKCGTGVPCLFGNDTNQCSRCNNRKCNVFTNCAQDYPPEV